MYHQIYPSSQKALYNPGDIIDFLITAQPNQAIELNKISVSGTLTVTGLIATDQATLDALDVNYDAICGIHGFVNNLTSSTSKNGTLENINNYPRLVKMTRSATNSCGDYATNSQYAAELCASDNQLTKYIMANRAAFPPVVAPQTPIMDNGISFSLIPYVCFNRAMSDMGPPLLSFDSVGNVKLSFRLVQPTEVLFGASAPNSSYTFSDLRLDYRAVATPKNISPINMVIISDVKQILDSSLTQININLPLSFYSMSGSFLQSTHENTTTNNNTELENPAVSKVFMQFNDATNNYLSFGLETTEDILENYLDSFTDGRPNHHDFTLEKIIANKAFGVGLSFVDAVALAQSGFGINITSGASAAETYYIYMFFRSVIPL